MTTSRRDEAGFSGLRPQSAAAAASDSSCLSTSLGDRRWQVTLAELSFRARRRETGEATELSSPRISSDSGGAEPAAPELASTSRKRRCGEANLLSGMGKRCVWPLGAV